MSGHDYEREFIRAELELQQERLDRAIAAMQAELDVYRDDWSGRHAEMMRAHDERVRQLEEDHKAWLANLINGESSEPAHTDVAGGHGASATGLAPAPGHGPRQPHPHVAELEAGRIQSMSMAEYAKRRAELGVRSPTDMSRLFGE